MGRKSKPKVDPLLLAAQQREEAKKPENWGLNPDTVRQAGVRVSAPVKGRIASIRRDDVFHRLHARGALSDIALLSIRRLDEDLAERAAEGRQGHSDKVDGGCVRRDITVQQIAVAERVEAVLGKMGRRDGALLVEMLRPCRVVTCVTVELGPDGGPVKRVETERWRLVVRLICGEAHLHAQGAALRSAVENLALAYREYDAEPRAKRAA